MPTCVPSRNPRRALQTLPACQQAWRRLWILSQLKNFLTTPMARSHAELTVPSAKGWAALEVWGDRQCLPTPQEVVSGPLVPHPHLGSVSALRFSVHTLSSICCPD